MKLRNKLIFISVLTAITIAINAYTIHLAFNPVSPAHSNGLFEYFDIFFGIILYCIAFDFVCDMLKKLLSRIILGVSCLTAFFACVIAENILLQFITYNSFFKWDNPCPYTVFLKKGIEYCIHNGIQNYTSFFITLFLYTVFISFFPEIMALSERAVTRIKDARSKHYEKSYDDTTEVLK